MSIGAADRVRASKLRRRIADGDQLSVDDKTWYSSYEAAKRGGSATAALAEAEAPLDASASERITYTEERSAAQGAHPHPDAYAAVARSEGLRADTLLRVASDAVVRAFEMSMRLNEHLLERTRLIEEQHIELMEAVRTTHLSRVRAEGEALRQQKLAELAELAKDGDDEGELSQLIGHVVRAMEIRAQQKEADKAPLGTIK